MFSILLVAYFTAGAIVRLSFATRPLHPDGYLPFPFPFLGPVAGPCLLLVAPLLGPAISLVLNRTGRHPEPTYRWWSRPFSCETCLRATLALTLAACVTWLGVVWNVDYAPSVRDQASDAANQAWMSDHGFSTERYLTRMVAGFPIQGLQGHGGGGFPGHIPFSKGSWVLLANFGLLLAPAMALAFFVSRRIAWTTAWVVAIAGPLCHWGGWVRYMVMSD